MDSVVAVDLGGTKLAAAVVDSEGRITERRKIPVERAGVRATAEQIADILRPLSHQRIGLVVPGIYNPGNGTAWAPNLWGHDHVPLRAELERTIPGRRVVIDSDRAGYVMGERWLGVARGIDDVVFVAIGTGIGAGIISGGRLLRGCGDIAGAVGWFALNPEWQESYSHAGCWESESAGPAVARHANTSSAEEAIAAAHTGNAAAQNAVRHAARYLGMGIANIVSLLNPQMVVLGGGLMHGSDLFLDTIREEMLRWAQPVAAQQVRIEITQLGEDAGLLGAAALAFDA